MGYIDYQVRGAVGVLTVCRPEAMNTLNRAVLGDLDRALDVLAADDEVAAVVLTGAGRAFVAGADIGEMREMDPVEAGAFSREGNRVFSKLENLEKPVIAAVNGFALGGGCELALSCDIRLAGEKARFGQPEVGLGITPGFGGTQRLSRLVGAGRAMELILTGKTIGAAEAERIGLVNAVCPQEELMDRAMELAGTIAAQARVAVRQAKRSIRRGMQTDIDTGLAYEAEAFALCFSTGDQREGMDAFLEKRDKRFTGR